MYNNSIDVDLVALLVVPATSYDCPDALSDAVLEAKLAYFLLKCLCRAIAPTVSVETRAHM